MIDIVQLDNTHSPLLFSNIPVLTWFTFQKHLEKGTHLGIICLKIDTDKYLKFSTVPQSTNVRIYLSLPNQEISLLKVYGSLQWKIA